MNSKTLLSVAALLSLSSVSAWSQTSQAPEAAAEPRCVPYGFNGPASENPSEPRVKLCASTTETGVRFNQDDAMKLLPLFEAILKENSVSYHVARPTRGNGDFVLFAERSAMETLLPRFTEATKTAKYTTFRSVEVWKETPASNTKLVDMGTFMCGFTKETTALRLAEIAENANVTIRELSDWGGPVALFYTQGESTAVAEKIAKNPEIDFCDVNWMTFAPRN